MKRIIFFLVLSLFAAHPLSTLANSVRTSYFLLTKISENTNGFNESVSSTCRFSLTNVGSTSQYYWVNVTATSVLSGGGTTQNATLRSGSSTLGTSSSPQTLTAGSSASFIYDYSSFPNGGSGAGKTQTLICAGNINVQSTTVNPGKASVTGTLSFYTENTQKHYDGTSTTSYLGSAATNIEPLEFSQKTF